MNYDQYIYGNVGKKSANPIPSNDDFHLDYLHKSISIMDDSYKPTQSNTFNSDSIAPTFQKENTDFVAGNAGDYNDGKGAESSDDWKGAISGMVGAMTKQDNAPVPVASDNGALAAAISRGAPALGSAPESSAINPYLMTASRLLGLNGGKQ